MRAYNKRLGLKLGHKANKQELTTRLRKWRNSAAGGGNGRCKGPEAESGKESSRNEEDQRPEVVSGAVPVGLVDLRKPGAVIFIHWTNQ